MRRLLKHGNRRRSRHFRDERSVTAVDSGARRHRRLLLESLEDRRLLSIDFPNFGSSAGLNLVGSAEVTDNVLRLTPAVSGRAGSAWFAEPQFVVDFDTTFDFRLSEGSDQNGFDGSDGFVFAVQNSDPTFLGGGGGGLGYSGLANSLVVEFDTFQNGDDPSPSHVSVHTAGTGTNGTSERFSLGAFVTDGFILDDANLHTVRIRYQLGSLAIFLDNLTVPALELPIDLAETLDLDAGRAWVGFTAATGGGFENHDILNWTYTSIADTLPVIGIGNVTQLEGSGAGVTNFVFTAHRLGDDSSTSSVDFATLGGTASTGTDFLAASGQLNFAAGQTEQTLIVAVNQDDLEEDYEDFFVELSNPVDAALYDQRGRGLIMNDETTISIGDGIGREDDDSGIFIDHFVTDERLNLATGLAFGPDGHLYVASFRGDAVLRFDGDSGEFLDAFVPAGSGGLDGAHTGLYFGPDGNLYIASRNTDSVLKYDSATGSFLGEFVASSSGGLDQPKGMVLGPDGHLYVGSAITDEVLRFHGTTGAFLGTFVTARSGGLDEPRGLTFGPDGNLFVSDQTGDAVYRYDGSTGDFIDTFVPAGSGGLDAPSGLSFGPQGNLYVVSQASGQVLVYDGSSGHPLGTVVADGPANLTNPLDLLFAPDGSLYVSDEFAVARFSVVPRVIVPVRLSSPVGQEISVDYATADSTAIAGSDYTATSGRLSFPPGLTSRQLIVPLRVDGLVESKETFFVNLSNPSAAASITDAQGVGAIVDADSPPLVLTAVSPPAASHVALVSTDVVAEFDAAVDAASATAQSFVVHSGQRGQMTDSTAVVSTSGQAITLDPAADFFPGELVQATVTSDIYDVTGQMAIPGVWQFRAAVTAGTGIFEAGELLGDFQSSDVAVGDLDGDGDLDAFVANTQTHSQYPVNRANRVWLNDGDGSFIDSGQNLGDRNSYAIALGDVDGDGDLDVFVVNSGAHGSTGGNRIWVNDGDGVFSDSGQSLGSSGDVSLGDLDGDGDLDAVLAQGGVRPNLVFLNDGSGVFTSTGQGLGDHSSRGSALGDLDGDGDLDAVFANWSFPGGVANRVWLNDGSGTFTAGQILGNHSSIDVALGDLDGDGDLDLFSANSRQGERIWRNNGNATFSNTGQILGVADSEGVSLGDLDADGDLDAFVSSSSSGDDRVWLNDGNGAFTDSGQELGSRNGAGSALGDLDGDGDLDAFVAQHDFRNLDGEGNRVWLNQQPPERAVTLSRDREAIAEDGGVAEFTVTLSNTTTVTVAVELGIGGTATNGVDFTISSDRVVIPPGGTTASVTVTAIDDAISDPDETVVIDVLSVSNAEELGIQQQTIQIIDNEGPPTRVVDVAPTANSPAAPATSRVRVAFDGVINSGTVNSQSLVIHSSARGRLSGGDVTLDTAGSTVTAEPVTSLQAGEQLSVSVTSNIESVSGPVVPQVWQFQAAVSGGTALFTENSPSLGNQDSFDVAFGDLDGDGDLDAFVASDYENRVWLNEAGTLRNSGQALGTGLSLDVELGDVDGDGDLDAFVVNLAQQDRIWLNDDGQFTDSGQTVGSRYSSGVSLGDVDGDGDLDAFLAGFPNQLWLNDGGRFTDTGQEPAASWKARLGDLDGDGDLDAVGVALYGFGITVLTNESGQFSPGQSIVGIDGQAISLGDLDGDGDLDMFLPVADGSGHRILWNTDGEFSDSGQRLGDHNGSAAALGDLDGDGDLDVWVAHADAEGGPQADRVWLNEGGLFYPTGESFGSDESLGVALGDLDGDGDLDALTANYLGSNRVWTNGRTETLPEVTLGVNAATVAEAGGMATISATLSSVSGLPVFIELAFSGSAVENEDFAQVPSQLVIPAGSTAGSVTIVAIQDELYESDELIVVDIAAVSNGIESGQQQQVLTLVDDDQPPALTVRSLSATVSGFEAEFSTALDLAVLNLYGTENGGNAPADFMVLGEASGPVEGSLVVDPSGSTVTFIKSGGPLAADTYTVALRSAGDGFRDLQGGLLDGDNDGAAGGDYLDTLIVPELPQDAITISIPDFVRGPGQAVHLPADGGSGIPLTISEGANVRAIDLQISYVPALLQIDRATVAAEMPAGSSVTVNTNTPGLAIVVFFSATALPAGHSTFINLHATVPFGSSAEIYGQQQIVNVHSVTISDGNDNEPPAIGDDGLHLASYLADVSGNGRVNAADAARLARVAALIDSGFGATLLTDPRLVGDISGNDRLNAADASLIAQYAALIDVPEIPAIPAGILSAGPVPWSASQGREDIDRTQHAAGLHITSGDGFSAQSNLFPPAVDRAITERDQPVSAGQRAVELDEAVDELAKSVRCAIQMLKAQ